MTGNNPKLDLVNINAYAKFGKILSIVLKIWSGNKIMTECQTTQIQFIIDSRNIKTAVLCTMRPIKHRRQHMLDSLCILFQVLIQGVLIKNVHKRVYILYRSVESISLVYWKTITQPSKPFDFRSDILIKIFSHQPGIIIGIFVKEFIQ